MKILHLCLASFYIDNYSYQENMLAKYHKKLGFEVEIISSLVSFDVDGKLCELKIRDSYYNEHNIQVTRLDYSRMIFSRRLRLYRNTYREIMRAEPDIIFIHGCQFIDIISVVKYVKIHPEVKVYIDNHADFNNSGKNFFSKNILHKLIWRRCAKLIEPYTRKFYGVLPARVDFLTDIYKVSKLRTELLVMGADDEKVLEIKKHHNSIDLKNKLELKNEDFIIITGGKIDLNKTQVLKLMKAVNGIENLDIKLVIFGSVAKEYRHKFDLLLSDRVKYVGWVNSSNIYEYFNIADLVFFPGLHSVLWEQAVGFGKPCVFKYIEGFTHIDVGGNCQFIYDDSVEEMIEVINSIVKDKNIYFNLLKNAQSKGINKFSYNKIAEKSIY